jgi:nucleoside-diphosphate-sugar epimerase
MPNTIILGCGDVGSRLARQYQARGLPVLGVVRSKEGVDRLAALGLESRQCDLAEAQPCALDLAGVDCFHLVPPPARGVEDLHTRRLIELFGAHGHPRRLVYMSTTGVYGDCAGQWIDESHPVRPLADRARRRWDAEERLRDWSAAQGRDLVVIRVAGIYGPDRLPLDRIRAGTPMVRPEEAPYTNRIHVDDLVTACVAAMERGEPGAVYNACDGHPSTMTAYFQAVAEAAGLPGPPLISLEEAAGRLSGGMLSYLSESRRIRNERLLEGLGIELRYPSLEDGLRALF